MEHTHELDRYQRQLILKGFGMAGQQKLKQSKVLVIGAGGLGCPIMQYLVAAGVGYIGLADNDKVSLSNLHRQVVFGTEDIGLYKVDVVKQKMFSLNSDVNIRTWNERWTQQDCLQHFPDYDVVVDATDNFASRYFINDACVLLGKPLVFGAVSQFDGQVAVFNQPQADGSRSVNYRDIFPLPPANGEVLNCSEAGVLGVLPGTIGTMQATEVIKLITGLGRTLSNRLWNYNALTQEVFIMELVSNPVSHQHIPSSEEQFMATDYEWLCGIPRTGIKEIDVLDWKQNFLDHLFVDVREPHELPRLDTLCSSLGLEWMELPLSGLENNLGCLTDRDVVFVCQAGMRSLMAADMLMKASPDSVVFSLKGGVRMLAEKKLISKMEAKKIKNIFTEGPVEAAFIADSIAKHATKTSIGGHSIFLGQVRADLIDGKQVGAIEYTSHVDMALEVMATIREDIFAKYALTCMHVHHSLGVVKAGEICLFVFTSSKHRKDAIEACSACVERIKAELPVWGKEIFEGEGYQWKKNK